MEFSTIKPCPIHSVPMSSSNRLCLVCEREKREAENVSKKKLPTFRDLEHINLSGDLDPTEYIRKLRED